MNFLVFAIFFANLAQPIALYRTAHKHENPIPFCAEPLSQTPRQALELLKSKRPSLGRRTLGEPGPLFLQDPAPMAIAALCARFPLAALGDGFLDELHDVARFSAGPEYTLDT